MKVIKTLIVAIILLLLTIIVQPGIMSVQPREIIYAEEKDQVFETLLEFSNNSELTKLLGKYNYEHIDKNINFREICLKIFIRNPRILLSILFTKPEASKEYIDFLYNNGLKIFDIIGEDDAFTIIESVKFRNSEIYEKINDIIDNDAELKLKVLTLNELNNNQKSDSPLLFHPIICAILSLIFLPLIIIGEFLSELFSSFNDLFPLLEEFFFLIWELSFDFSIYFLTIFGCIEWPWYM